MVFVEVKLKKRANQLIVIAYKHNLLTNKMADFSTALKYDGKVLVDAWTQVKLEPQPHVQYKRIY